MKVRDMEASAAWPTDLQFVLLSLPPIIYLLGALPDKGDLMHDPAMDEELERL